MFGTNFSLLWELFSTFFRIGAFTLGGGYVMIPLIENEVVEQRGWMQHSEFSDMLPLIQASPGPIAINAAVFVGYKTKGLAGVFFAVLGVVIPSFVIILLVAHFFSNLRDNDVVTRIFKGIRPAVVALIAVPVVNLLKKDGFRFKTLVLALVAAVAVWQFSVSPIWLIAGAGALGLLQCRLS